MGTADMHYGSYAVELEPVLAFSEVTETDRQAMEAAVANLRWEFPQIYLGIYLGPAPEGPSVGSFAFWLLNRGKATAVPQEIEWTNRDTIVVVVDPDKKESVVTLGYHAEHWISHAACHEALTAASPAFARRDWLSGIGTLVESFRTALGHSADEFLRTQTATNAPVDKEGSANEGVAA